MPWELNNLVMHRALKVFNSYLEILIETLFLDPFIDSCSVNIFASRPSTPITLYQMWRNGLVMNMIEMPMHMKLNGILLVKMRPSLPAWLTDTT